MLPWILMGLIVVATLGLGIYAIRDQSSDVPRLSEAERRDLRVFALPAIVGWLALGVAFVAWLMWAQGGRIEANEEWSAWNARIERLGWYQNAGEIVAALVGLMSIFIPPRSGNRAIKLMAVAPLFASVLFFGFTIVALLSLGIR